MDGLGHEVPDPHAGIQAGERVLKDHLDLAAVGLQSLCLHDCDVFAIKDNPSAIYGIERSNHPRDRGLARATFAHKAENLSVANVETHLIDGSEVLALRW